MEGAGVKKVSLTGDILLDKRCIKSRAIVLHHDGKSFDATNIGSAIATRAIMEYLRAGDGRSGRRTAAVQQGGPVELTAGAGPGAGEDGAGVSN